MADLVQNIATSRRAARPASEAPDTQEPPFGFAFGFDDMANMHICIQRCTQFRRAFTRRATGTRTTSHVVLLPPGRLPLAGSLRGRAGSMSTSS